MLSYPLSLSTPLYGDTPRIEITPHKRIGKGDSSNTSIIKFHNHSGTHIDAPQHFSENGRKIVDYCIEELIFKKPFLIDCPKSSKEMIRLEDITKFDQELGKCDMLLLRTGFWKCRQSEIYRLENPGILPEIAAYIRSKKQNIHCLGIDSISVSSYLYRDLGRETHKIFLQKGTFSGEPLLLIEDMNLSYMDLSAINSIIVAPFIIEEIDSAPCTVLGIVN